MKAQLRSGRRPAGKTRRVKKSVTLNVALWDQITALTSALPDGDSERASNSRWIENACLARLDGGQKKVKP
jgi:hypothetical protein